MTVNMDKTPGESDLATDLGISYTIPRVNLLPPEIIAARALARTQRWLGAALVLVVIAIAGAFVLFQQRADDAAQTLAAEQARTAVLQKEQAQYARVPVVLAQVEAATAARETAMATDVAWYDYLDRLALTYPAGIWFGDLTAAVAAPSLIATPSVDAIATPGIGSVTFTGSGVTPPDVANLMDVLDGTDGFADTALTSVTRTDSDGQVVVDYSVQAVLTDAALSHRFDRKAS